MRRLAAGVEYRRPRTRRVLAPKADGHTAFTATRLATAGCVMAPGVGWTMPRLDGVATEHQVWHGQRLAARTAAAFVRAGVADATDWPSANGNPSKFLESALNRWVADHGGQRIGEVFQLHLTLSSSLDPYSSSGAGDQAGSTLYLTLEPESAGYMVLGPTLRLLEPIHPRLPVTFVHMLIGALNRAVRVYDWRDALARVEQLREWYEMDPAEDGEVELPDVARSIPASIRKRPLCRSTVARLLPTIRDRLAQALIEAALELDVIAARVRRPVVTDGMAELLQDCGDPLPTLLAVFEKHDAIEGQFDEESQGMLEVTPEPNAIIAMDISTPASVATGFGLMVRRCSVLARAVQILKAIPMAHPYPRAVHAL